MIQTDIVAPPQLKQESVRLIWGGVPIRNPDFTGREELLRRLRELIADGSKVSVLPQALHGFGGVGKTQLAIEYVYRYASEYDLVWWLSAELPSQVRAPLGERLGLPAVQRGPPADRHHGAGRAGRQLAAMAHRVRQRRPAGRHRAPAAVGGWPRHPDVAQSGVGGRRTGQPDRG